MELTKESMQAAREYFAKNALQCIADVQNGTVRVNDPDAYFAYCRQRHDDTLAGKNDHTFTLRQYAYYLQTGVCVPLLA